MKNNTMRFTRKIAAMIAAITAMSAFAAVNASASDAENEEIIAAAKANAALHDTWEDIESDTANEDEIDQVCDLLERLDIVVDCYNGEDKNCYSVNDSTLTHEQTMEIIRNANPEGCIKNPFNMDFDTEDDDNYENVLPEEAIEDNGEDEDGDSCFEFDFDFGDIFTDKLFG